MSEPYNPCDGNDSWILAGKEWELLRRNQDFRELLKRVIADRNPEKYRSLSQRCRGVSNGAGHLILFAGTDGPIGQDIRRGRFLLDLAFPDAIDRLGTSYVASLNEIDPHKLYVCPPESFDEHEVFGVDCSYWEVDPYEADSDHHVFLIPKSMPNRTARDEMLNSIKPLIELEGIKEKNLRAPKKDKAGRWQGGGSKGSREQWSTFLGVEEYLKRNVQEGDVCTPEIVEEALQEVIFEDRGDDMKHTWLTKYRERYYRIIHLINDAFPVLSELE